MPDFILETRSVKMIGFFYG